MKLRHKTTTATIGGTQWNEDHVLSEYSLGSISGAVTINLANGSVQTATLTGNVTFTLPSVSVGTTEHLTLVLINNGTGGYSISFDSGNAPAWVGGSAPEFDDTPNAKNILVFRHGGGAWIGDGGVFG